MHNDGKTSTILAEFKDTSDHKNFTKDEDIKVVGDLQKNFLKQIYD